LVSYSRPCAEGLSVAGFPAFMTRFTVGQHFLLPSLIPVSLLDNTGYPFHCWS